MYASLRLQASSTPPLPLRITQHSTHSIRRRHHLLSDCCVLGLLLCRRLLGCLLQRQQQSLGGLEAALASQDSAAFSSRLRARAAAANTAGASRSCDDGPCSS